jgi:hypothetical protein
VVVTTDSGRGAGADPAGDSAGADFSTAAVVVTAAVGAGAALVGASAADGAAVTLVVGAALVGVVVGSLCADGAALEVAGEDAEDGGTDEAESVTEVVGAVADAGVSVVVPGAEVVGLVGVAEVSGAADVAGAIEVVGVVEGLTGGALGVLVGATAGTNSADDGGTV